MAELEPVRTILFVPGNRADRIDKALGSQADAAIIDLEDAVPTKSKDEARSIVREKLLEHSNKKVLVRVNGIDTDFFLDDIQAIAVSGLSCIMVPKVEKSADIRTINDSLTQAENKNEVEEGSIKVISLIETALGVENVFDIVSERTSPERLFTAAFGAADFALDMGIEMTPTGEELHYPRSKMAISCIAAKIPPPLDSPFMLDINDLETLEADARRSKQLGFQGKLCIHPKQIDVCNRVFSPTEEEIEYAKRVINAFEQAEASGQAAIKLDNKFIDYPIVHRAQRIVKLAEKISNI
ncbi:MAG: CoA ester lyase [Desulfovermiculus sp.]|nr:CoA ester lyase [Desulfovermiculus sp.]